MSARIDIHEQTAEEARRLNLRDSLAGLAMQTILAEALREAHDDTWQDIAADAYRMADAMMKTRGLNNG
jgi:hypothetical protein